MKKLINKVDNIVDEMLDGMTAAYPQYVKRLEGLNVLVRAKGATPKVALVSGGGSGHEPSHGGFVGRGMLDGAVAGEVFTSPTPDQVYEAVKAVNGGKGVLLVIKNYTGDVMNFEMAEEMAGKKKGFSFVNKKADSSASNGNTDTAPYKESRAGQIQKNREVKTGSKSSANKSLMVMLVAVLGLVGIFVAAAIILKMYM